MAKQAIKKSSGIKGSLKSFKDKMGIGFKENTQVTQIVSNANKPLNWIIMPKAYQEATKLPGLPTGTVISCIGHSNVGKSTLINHAIVSAQRSGTLPVIIDTENAFSFQYAISMGFKAEPIYGDVEVEIVDPDTGEITTETRNEIVYWEGDFLYVNNTILCSMFGKWDYKQGKETSKQRNTAVVEDVAMFMKRVLESQDEGEIMQDILFVWDSVGSIGSYKEYDAKGVGNAMWTAASISAAFNELINDKIPSSRKISSKYTNTFLYINKVWMDSMTSPVGPPTMQTKGGKSLKYATRLEILMGGQLTSGIKRLTASSKGLNYSYGIETKIKVLKNHLDAPHNVCYEGNMIACDVGFISPNDLDQYKKEHIGDILKQLNNLLEKGSDVNISASDVTFGETEEDMIVE